MFCILGSYLPSSFLCPLYVKYMMIYKVYKYFSSGKTFIFMSSQLNDTESHECDFRTKTLAMLLLVSMQTIFLLPCSTRWEMEDVCSQFVLFVLWPCSCHKHRFQNNHELLLIKQKHFLGHPIINIQFIYFFHEGHSLAHLSWAWDLLRIIILETKNLLGSVRWCNLYISVKLKKTKHCLLKGSNKN